MASHRRHPAECHYERSTSSRALGCGETYEPLIDSAGAREHARGARCRPLTAFNEYDADNFRQAGSYLGTTYSELLLIVEIASLENREDQRKKSLLVEIKDAAGGVAADDVFVMITDIGRANASFGGGGAPGVRLEPLG